MNYYTDETETAKIWHLLLTVRVKAKHDAAAPGWSAVMYKTVTKFVKHDLPSSRAKEYFASFVFHHNVSLTQKTRQGKKGQKKTKNNPHRCSFFKKGLIC